MINLLGSHKVRIEGKGDERVGLLAKVEFEGGGNNVGIVSCGLPVDRVRCPQRGIHSLGIFNVARNAEEADEVEMVFEKSAQQLKER